MKSFKYLSDLYQYVFPERECFMQLSRLDTDVSLKNNYNFTSLTLGTKKHHQMNAGIQ